jgi:hypothetical protein
MEAGLGRAEHIKIEIKVIKNDEELNLKTSLILLFDPVYELLRHVSRGDCKDS